MKVQLRNVRASYVNVHTPRKPSAAEVTKNKMTPEQVEQKTKYEITFILDEKTNATEIAAIKKAQAELMNDPKFGGKKPTLLALRKGDDTPAREEDPALGAGKWTISAKSKVKPKIVDMLKNDLSADSGKPYSGCYVHGTIDLFPYNNEQRGISSEIIAVMFVKDGERLGGRGPVDVDEEFGDVEADSNVSLD